MGEITEEVLTKLTRAERKLAGLCMECGCETIYFSEDVMADHLFAYRKTTYEQSVIKGFCFDCWSF